MSTTSRHDAWSAGDSYDLYMGRWSRQVAPRFLDWMGAPTGAAWLDVGCGTGALSAAILDRCDPRSLVGIDPSEGFVARARQVVADPRAAFEIGDAQALPLEDASRDVVASGLVLNFVSDRPRALAEMRRVAMPGGLIAFYVWDYAGGGVEFMRAFWDAANSLDPTSRELAENKRFPFCTADGLTALAKEGGLHRVEIEPIEVATVFADFDDFWRPFTLGAGPAPGYCVSLEPEARERLRHVLAASLPHDSAGRIPLKARAWAVKATS